MCSYERCTFQTQKLKRPHHINLLGIEQVEQNLTKKKISEKAKDLFIVISPAVSTILLKAQKALIELEPGRPELEHS